jgi:hypothetical protein
MLSEKVLGYSSIVKLIRFGVTPGHNREIWITLAVPLICPLVTLRTLLVLLIAATSVLVETFMTELLLALE